MADRVIDPDRFILLGAVTDWLAVSRRHLHEQRPDLLARQRGISTRIVQLRWLVAPEVGYPTAPFKVWRRPAIPMDIERPFQPEVLPTPFGWQVITWDEPRVSLRAQFLAAGAATVAAFAGATVASAMGGI